MPKSSSARRIGSVEVVESVDWWRLLDFGQLKRCLLRRWAALGLRNVPGRWSRGVRRLSRRFRRRAADSSRDDHAWRFRRKGAGFRDDFEVVARTSGGSVDLQRNYTKISGTLKSTKEWGNSENVKIIARPVQKMAFLRDYCFFF